MQFRVLKNSKIEKPNSDQAGLGRKLENENTQETRSQSSAETPHFARQVTRS